METFQFTVPKSKEALLPEIEQFVHSASAKYRKSPSTKDGTTFHLEFSVEGKKERFKGELSRKFPFLFV
jgi:hypothetical protein